MTAYFGTTKLFNFFDTSLLNTKELQPLGIGIYFKVSYEDAKQSLVSGGYVYKVHLRLDSFLDLSEPKVAQAFQQAAYANLPENLESFSAKQLDIFYKNIRNFVKETQAVYTTDQVCVYDLNSITILSCKRIEKE